MHERTTDSKVSANSIFISILTVWCEHAAREIDCCVKHWCWQIKRLLADHGGWCLCLLPLQSFLLIYSRFVLTPTLQAFHPFVQPV